MRKFRVLFLSLILALGMSGATATAYADGPTETPGVINPVDPGNKTNQASTSTASTCGGPTETPGLITILIEILTGVI
jgi:hypothetical protein